MERVFHGHALCQALILEGIPSRYEHSIENRIRQLWVESGPDFTLEYLKELKRRAVLYLTNTDGNTLPPLFENGSVSVAWNYKAGRPKGPLGRLFNSKYMIKNIRLINACIQTIKFEEATPKQLTKFLKGIRSDRLERERYFDSPYQFEVKEVLKPLYNTINRNLRRRMQQVDYYSPMDLTASTLPYGNKSHNLAPAKQVLDKLKSSDCASDRSAIHHALYEIHTHYMMQYRTAPRIAHEFWNEITQYAYSDERIKDHEIQKHIRDLSYPSHRDIPGFLIPNRFIDYKKLQEGIDMNYHNISKRDVLLGAADTAGRIEFLQQPGGKLRSIANVNRFVNYTLDPLAKAIEDTIYNKPEVFVKSQRNGLAAVQKQLQLGKKLYSFDLSSATDTLYFDLLIDALHHTRNQYENHIYEDQFGYVDKFMTYLQQISRLPFYCEGLKNIVQFKTGQPLGTKGSFQVLTLMNYVAGTLARMKMRKPDAFFAIVGDDFVCEEHIAKSYVSYISSMGGLLNFEKTMSSNVYGEFLSKFITKSKVYDVKPQYKPSSKFIYQNLEKSKIKNMKRIFKFTQEEREAIDILSRYSVDNTSYLTNLPKLRSKDTTVDEERLYYMHSALRVLASIDSVQGTLDISLSDQAVRLLLEETKSVSERECPFGYPSTLIRHGVTTYPSAKTKFDHREQKTVNKLSNSDLKKTYEELSKRLKIFEDAYIKGSFTDIELKSGGSVSSETVALVAMEATDALQHNKQQMLTEDPDDSYFTEQSVKTLKDLHESTCNDRLEKSKHEEVKPPSLVINDDGSIYRFELGKGYVQISGPSKPTGNHSTNKSYDFSLE